MSLEILSPLHEDCDDLAIVLGEPDEAEFWHLVIRQAWDDEWFYEPGGPFDGDRWEDVEEAWAEYVRKRIAAPEWRWWVWRDHEDGESRALEQATADDEGAFQAAVVREAA